MLPCDPLLSPLIERFDVVGWHSRSHQLEIYRSEPSCNAVQREPGLCCVSLRRPSNMLPDFFGSCFDWGRVEDEGTPDCASCFPTRPGMLGDFSLYICLRSKYCFQVFSDLKA